MKKLISGILTVVMFISILISLALFGIRAALSEGAVSKMLDVMVEEYDITKDLLDSEEELEEVLEDKKAKKLMAKVISGYVKYTAGITDEQPDIEPLFEYIADETDIDVDEDEIDEAIEEFEAEMEANREATEDESLEIVKTIFSTGLLVTFLLISAGCAFVIYALSKDSKKAIKRLGIVTIINGAIIFVLGNVFVNFMRQETSASEEAVLALAEVMVNSFKSVGLIGIVVGIVLIVVAVKLLKNNISASNQAIENLDNSVLK